MSTARPEVVKRENVAAMPRTAVSTSALMTPEAVANLLGVSRDWVLDHATRRNPRIPVVRLGGRRALLRFRPEDIDSFIAQHLVPEVRV